MSVIFRVLGAELRFTVCCALTDPSVALNKGPNMAAAAALRNIDRRVGQALLSFLHILILSQSCWDLNFGIGRHPDRSRVATSSKSRLHLQAYRRDSENATCPILVDKSTSHHEGHRKVPRAYPYGIYDLGRNVGFVNVGTDHDTGAFAVASIRGWWRAAGHRLYPRTRRLLITADAGGSNGWRLRLWKWELQGLADQTGLTLTVCHFPPGTSKWNKVEHRLFSFIPSNWRGEPLRDYETVVRLIAGTTTAKGLTVTCRLDHRKYPVGRKITDDEFAHVNSKPDKFHGEWNYTIHPGN